MVTTLPVMRYTSTQAQNNRVENVIQTGEYNYNPGNHKLLTINY